MMKNHIRAHTHTRTHTHTHTLNRYRDSKLTHMLKESLGGNSRTCLLTTISPELADAQETLNSIRFGSIAQSVKINPRVNIRRSNAQLVAELETMRKIVFTLEKENEALRVVNSNNGEESECVVLKSTIASLMSKVATMSSELKTSREQNQVLRKIWQHFKL